MIERRLEAEEWRFGPLVGPPHFFAEDLAAAKRRVLFILLYANGAILIFSGTAGYFLAGKTLKPIEGAMEEQKRFVADASHELRTPLTALKTSMEVALRDKKMPLKEARKTIKESLEDIDNLQSLTNGLLNLTHYQDNDGRLVFEEVDLAEVIKKAYKKISPLAKKKGVEIEFQVDTSQIEANKESLEEMLVIFLDNAIKYTSEGGKVTVRAKFEKRYAVLEIKDTGIGIDKKDLPHIFDRFYRVDKSRSETGFGLGLSIAKRIIDLHRGSIDVSSTIGKGTTFTIKLSLKHA